MIKQFSVLSFQFSVGKSLVNITAKNFNIISEI